MSSNNKTLKLLGCTELIKLYLLGKFDCNFSITVLAILESKQPFKISFNIFLSVSILKLLFELQKSLIFSGL